MNVSPSPNAQPLRLGVSSGTFYPDVPTEEAPALAARLGFADVEVMLQTAGEYGADFLRRLGANARAAGCRIHAVHGWQALHPLVSPYRRRAEEGRALFDQAIAGTAELNARVLVWHGPTRAEVATADGWARFLAVTDELATVCAEAGISLALENVSWCALASVRDVAAFAAALPELGPPGSIGFAFDPFQAAEAGANPFMVLAAMADHVVDIHLSDLRESDRTKRHLLPGDGDLPWPALLRAIANTTYRGPLMIEGPSGGDLAALERARDRLAPILVAATNRSARGATDVCAGAPPPGVREGIRLFNERAFYECHEAIEQEWHAERGEIRKLYQGILQIGVGFHHARNANHRGAVLLLTDGIAKTARFVPRCLGLDTARLVAESQACLDRILDLGPSRLQELDWESVPFVHDAADNE